MAPEVLYKYRNFEKYTLLGLIHGTYWLATPSQLNDPFDAQLKPVVEPIPEKLFYNEIDSFISRQKKFNKKIFNFTNVELLYQEGVPSGTLIDNVRAFTHSVESIATNIGVFSLSETSTSTTMWSHYGDEHKGICIGYKSDYLLSIPNSSEQRCINPIYYLPEQELSRNAYLLYARSGMGADIQLLVDYILFLLSQKSTDWNYEKEWRLLVPYLGGQAVEHGLETIQSITFGLRTPIDVKSTVRKILKNNKIEYFQSVRHDFHLSLVSERMSENSEHWSTQYEKC